MYANGNPVSYIDKNGLEFSYIDPVFQPAIDNLRKRSKDFRRIYDEMNKSSSNYKIKCNKNFPARPEPGYSPASSGVGFGWPPPYVITIDANAGSYGYPGVDGRNHLFSMERIISHEIAHPGVGIGQRNEAQAISLENIIMNQFEPNSINRNRNTNNIIRPGDCGCEN